MNLPSTNIPLRFRIDCTKGEFEFDLINLSSQTDR